MNIIKQAGVHCTLAFGAILATSLATSPAQAQSDYPNRAISITVPFAAGGTTDILARIIGQQLNERWKVPVLVENKSGASGTVGSAEVARAPADGYSLLMGTSATHVNGPNLYKNIPYDPVKDFSPITRAGIVSNVLVVPANAPYNSVQELIAYGRANPDKLTFGSSGYGTTQHLAGEIFKLKENLDMVHVPYRGSTLSLADLIGGQISMIFDNLPSALPHVQSGRLKALAVTAATRSEHLPDIPTMMEAGVADFDVTAWFGLLAPAGVPADIMTRLNREVVDILNMPDIQRQIRDMGAVPSPESPQAYRAVIIEEGRKSAELVRAAKLAVQ